MALVNELDELQTQTTLATWLAGKLPDAEAVDVTDVVVPQGSGMSMTTILFKASVRGTNRTEELDLVARVSPDGPTLMKSPDLGREYRVISTLAERAPVPAPRMRWHEEDRSVLGGEFVVMDRAYGNAPADDPPFTAEGWVLDLAPDQRGTLVRNGLQVVADLHALDYEALGLGFLDEPRFGVTGVAQQIGSWTDFYEWAAAGKPSPTIDAGLEWLRERQPDTGDVVLNWGDARVGNIMFGDDQSVQVALDWELATLAEREMDLAWWLFIQRHHTEGVGVPLPDGLPDRAETIALYEELTGHTVANMELHDVFAAVRSSILMVRVGSMMIAGGVLPADHPMPFANPSSTILAKLLDLPAPDGLVAGPGGRFLGDR